MRTSARTRCATASLGIAALLSACSLSPAGVLDALVPTSGYVLERGVPYGPGARQTLDVYRPEAPAARTRNIVFVYGGAWRDGRKEDYRFVGQSLAAAGHTVIIPDYRLYPEVTYPAFVDDVVDAVARLAGDEPDHPLDAFGDIVLMGHSSGAHTVALLASDPRRLEGIGVRAIALVGISGPYDLPLDDPEVEPVFAGVEDPARVSPPSLVTPVHPPTLLLHGRDDERVLPKHTERYAAALRSAGVALSVEWFEHAGHVSAVVGLATPLKAINRAREAVLEFLEEL